MTMKDKAFNAFIEAFGRKPKDDKELSFWWLIGRQMNGGKK